MLHLVLCFTVWIIIFSYLGWRSLIITKRAAQHLKRLHQIPCDKCVYFTGDYRLKCTVHPMSAMSEDAIACRDFSPQVVYRPSAPKTKCGGCFPRQNYTNSLKQSKFLIKLQFPNLNHEDIPFNSTSLD